MINSDILLQKMRERGYSLVELGERMSLPLSVLGDKIRGTREFSTGEIYALSHILALSVRELEDIFFCNIC